jgi:hypothetical protein
MGANGRSEMDVKLFGLLVEKARHRETIAYSDTGKSRAVIGPLLDEINRHEHLEGRPMLSVIVVHKGTPDPGPGFIACAEDLGVLKSGDDKKTFVESERARVFKTWAG